METKLSKDSIVVGMDIHKYFHTAVALDILGNRQMSESFSNDKLDEFVFWLEKLGTKQHIVVGMEDIGGHGIHVARRLMKEEFDVRYVPAIITDRFRKHSVHREKNDWEDARRVGLAILHRSEEALPASSSIPKNYEEVRTLDLMLSEREMLVREQTILKNILHNLLHQHYGNGYKQDFSNPFAPQRITWYQQNLSTKPGKQQGYLAESIGRRLKRLAMIQEQVKEITTTITNISKDNQELKLLRGNLKGCGVLTACKIIAEVKTIERFATKDKLARYAGIAPTDHGSAGKIRLHTDFSGNRKLNRAIHTVALFQLGNNGLPQAKEYMVRKVSEGKTKLWALRCLKRRVINRVFAILSKQPIVNIA